MYKYLSTKMLLCSLRMGARWRSASTHTAEATRCGLLGVGSTSPIGSILMNRGNAHSNDAGER